VFHGPHGVAAMNTSMKYGRSSILSYQKIDSFLSYNIYSPEMSIQEGPTKSKRVKKPAVKEVPETCSICAENYTAIIRKKCVCKYCNNDACSKCIERYLLDRHEDAHCLKCRVNYNDAALHEICTKTYLNQVYFKHRQEVLINRERANLPGLQQEAINAKLIRDNDAKIAEIRKEMAELRLQRDEVMMRYNTTISKYYSKLANKEKNEAEKYKKEADEIIEECNRFRELISEKEKDINRIRWAPVFGGADSIPAKPEEEKKKFIRRCTRDGCQGFLSTAWKCGICEYYSCSKCFKNKTKKQDDPHECTKEDLETAELIKKDCKPCPNCGEFIMKTSGCSQMWCISCQTPWDWTTGKIVTNGIIHNPHYYEWMKRNGGGAPRNPADIPCGGYPNMWELRKMPKGINTHISTKFYEFHRICQELQDISERGYRSHIDNATTTGINVKFLLGDFDEKRWGQNLAKTEKKRKRDNEVQEIFVAFRMVAVELINRVQNYDDGTIRNFSVLPVKIAEKFIENLDIEIQALITMINDALRNVSISYCYSVPYINMDGGYYGIKTKNFASEVKKKKKDVVVKEGSEGREGSLLDVPGAAAAVAAAVAREVWETDSDDSDDSDIISKIEYKGPPSTAPIVQATEEELFNELDRIQGRTKAVREPDNSDDDNTAIQRAIVASLEK